MCKINYSKILLIAFLESNYFIVFVAENTCDAWLFTTKWLSFCKALYYVFHANMIIKGKQPVFYIEPIAVYCNYNWLISQLQLIDWLTNY